MTQRKATIIPPNTASCNTERVLQKETKTNNTSLSYLL